MGPVLVDAATAEFGPCGRTPVIGAGPDGEMDRAAVGCDGDEEATDWISKCVQGILRG
jgi:hypothetical protein